MGTTDKLLKSLEAKLERQQKAADETKAQIAELEAITRAPKK